MHGVYQIYSLVTHITLGPCYFDFMVFSENIILVYLTKMYHTIPFVSVQSVRVSNLSTNKSKRTLDTVSFFVSVYICDNLTCEYVHIYVCILFVMLKSCF